MMLKLSKISLVFMIGIFALLVFYNNVVDYDTNFNYVQHVLSMDTIFGNQTLISRAITSSRLHHICYCFIIIIELFIGVFCTFGSIQLFLARKSPMKDFLKAKSFANIGLVLGFGLWFFAFTTIGAEWFQMWRSNEWNGQNVAFRTVVCMGIVMIFLNQKEEEL